MRELTRRKFLAAVGATGAAAATLVATQASKSPVASSKAPAKGEGKGYQLTEHVQRYYRTTLV